MTSQAPKDKLLINQALFISNKYEFVSTEIQIVYTCTS